MAISRKLLNDDESVVVSTRTHAKALLGPALVLILVAAVAGFVTSFTPAAGRAAPLLQAAIGAVAAVFVFRWVVKPFLVWLTTTYTVTNRRLITRSGILSRRGHDIPLARVSDVSYERGLLDRLLGCGTLLVAVASEQRVELHDIPQVEQVHLRIHDLLFDGSGAWDVDDRTQRLDDGR